MIVAQLIDEIYTFLLAYDGFSTINFGGIVFKLISLMSKKRQPQNWKKQLT